MLCAVKSCQMGKIEMTVAELENMLLEQKRSTAEYITRNLTVYHWYGMGNKVDSDKAKEELKTECLKSHFPNDFSVLKKFVKQ